MRRRRDINGRLRDPYVRPLTLTGCVVLALWGASATDLGQTTLYWNVGEGHPLFGSNGFEFDLLGLTYSEESGFFGRLWFLKIRAGFITFLLSSAAVGLMVWRVSGIWRTRRNPHSCPNCGYDLRASRDRCPECGKPILGAAATVSP